MQKICRQCGISFEIAATDQKFYEKISVPEPTRCPDCRKQRRLAWRNERTLFSRTCDQCQKTMVSLYSEEKPYPVYCHECWWSNAYDPLQYGQDFDFSKPFFEQFRALQQRVPRLTLFNTQHENAEYANHSANNKDGYLLFSCFHTENVYYSRMVKRAKDCVDCSTLIGHCELCYQCIQCEGCFNLKFSRYCVSSRDSWFLLDCRNCTDCFGCVGLRNKRYYWFNQSLTPEEYNERLKQFVSSSYQVLQAMKTKFEAHALQYPRPQAFLINCEECTGDELINCKRCVESYDLQNALDCKFYETGSNVRDSYDIFGAGGAIDEAVIEFLYEDQGVIGSQNQFCNACYQRGLKQYCDLCQNSQECFGCIGAKSNTYCILNKQYTKDEYYRLREKIIDHMKSTGEYGEFFPIAISPFAYNETVAQEYFPLTKPEAMQRGFAWSDYEPPKPDVKHVLNTSELPDRIEEVSDDILSQAIECEITHKPFRIIPQELKFYREHHLPLPRRHPDQRHHDRTVLNNPRKLWGRQCMCEVRAHEWHSASRCPHQFQTTYAPERPEKVFCEQCYLKEVY